MLSEFEQPSKEMLNYGSRLLFCTKLTQSDLQVSLFNKIAFAKEATKSTYRHDKTQMPP